MTTPNDPAWISGQHAQHTSYQDPKIGLGSGGAAAPTTDAAKEGYVPSRLSDVSLKAAYVSLAGTPVGSPPVVKTVNDARNGVWEYINDSAQPGYLYHLLIGQDSGAGAWTIGVGVDAGLGNGIIVRNKAGGIGLKVEQLSTVNSATSVGFSIQHDSSVAPAAQWNQMSDGTATLFELNSYVTDPTVAMQKWNSAVGTAGQIHGATGTLEWYKTFSLTGSVPLLDLRDEPWQADEWAHHIKMNFQRIQWDLNVGSNQWQGYRFKTTTDHWSLQATGATATPDTATYIDMLSVRPGELGFFGTSTAVKQTVTGAKGGNAALASLLQALAAYGLVTDSTTA